MIYIHKFEGFIHFMANHGKLANDIGKHLMRNYTDVKENDPIMMQLIKDFIGRVKREQSLKTVILI
ncbi:hypothetical protein [Salirhabdus salicampi]|uniref:hypothetical protein n=1 Tax=Salirhabdus salicampi TaxID=476102 RepID=UPI0020C1BF47|nr:hypothetical protein [Salirhabdus salicampi]MCP8616263.1 hypothetical protein [Salirhabdus salicampi]